MRGLPRFLEGAMQRALKDFGDEAVDLNIEQMEKLGQDSRGVEFGDYSAASQEVGYPEQKAAMGKESRFINLNFEGDFHGGMDFRVTQGGLEITSKDGKTEMLIKNYGKDIFGLNDKNFDVMFDDVAEHIERELISYFV